MSDYTCLEYVGYSESKNDFIEIGVYIETAKIKHQYGLKPKDDLKGIIEKISSEDVLSLIDTYGCSGFEIY